MMRLLDIIAKTAALTSISFAAILSLRCAVLWRELTALDAGVFAALLVMLALLAGLLWRAVP